MSYDEKYLQKLGKALMLPVAALPVCGILMESGLSAVPLHDAGRRRRRYRCRPIGFLLVKAGGALIDNMAAVCCWCSCRPGR